jgi:hypothetical protein
MTAVQGRFRNNKVVIDDDIRIPDGARLIVTVVDDTVPENYTDSGLKLFHDMRAEAEERGFLSEEEIEAEIQAVRTDMRSHGVIL